MRNAEVISARDSSTLHPGTVDVVVYPPLSVADWTLDDLTDRIAEVRQLFVDTLADWPVDKVPDAALYRRKKAPARKQAAKKPAAKKATAKKATAKKSTAKKATGTEVKGRR